MRPFVVPTTAPIAAADYTITKHPNDFPFWPNGPTGLQQWTDMTPRVGPPLDPEQNASEQEQQAFWDSYWGEFITGGLPVIQDIYGLFAPRPPVQQQPTTDPKDNTVLWVGLGIVIILLFIIILKK